MRITYDKAADAAYIYLINHIDDGGVTSTYTCDGIDDIKDMINMDFNEDGKLLGIEVLSAESQLPKELLDAAEIIG